jgi:carboxypeptidase Taq
LRIAVDQINEIIKTIREKPQVDDSFLHQAFDEQKQLAFGKEVITKFGFDWQRGRQDLSPHPFTSGIGINDVRFTTRINSNFLNPSLFGSLHECGHAFMDWVTAPSWSAWV